MIPQRPSFRQNEQIVNSLKTVHQKDGQKFKVIHLKLFSTTDVEVQICNCQTTLKFYKSIKMKGIDFCQNQDLMFDKCVHIEYRIVLLNFTGNE